MQLKKYCGQLRRTLNAEINTLHLLFGLYREKSCYYQILESKKTKIIDLLFYIKVEDILNSEVGGSAWRQTIVQTCTEIPSLVVLHIDHSLETSQTKASVAVQQYNSRRATLCGIAYETLYVILQRLIYEAVKSQFIWLTRSFATTNKHNDLKHK